MSYDEKLKEFKSRHLPKASNALFQIQPQINDLLENGYTKQQIFEFVDFLGLEVSRATVFRWIKKNVNNSRHLPQESEIANKQTSHRNRLDQFLGKSLEEQLKEMR